MTRWAVTSARRGMADRGRSDLWSPTRRRPDCTARSPQAEVPHASWDEGLGRLARSHPRGERSRTSGERWPYARPGVHEARAMPNCGADRTRTPYPGSACASRPGTRGHSHTHSAGPGCVCVWSRRRNQDRRHPRPDGPGPCRRRASQGTAARRSDREPLTSQGWQPRGRVPRALLSPRGRLQPHAKSVPPRCRSHCAAPP